MKSGTITLGGRERQAVPRWSVPRPSSSVCDSCLRHAVLDHG